MEMSSLRACRPHHAYLRRRDPITGRLSAKTTRRAGTTPETRNGRREQQLSYRRLSLVIITSSSSTPPTTYPICAYFAYLRQKWYCVYVCVRVKDSQKRLTYTRPCTIRAIIVRKRPLAHFNAHCIQPPWSSVVQTLQYYYIV